MVSPHLSALSFPGARGPDGAQAPRQGALALGPGYGAGAWGRSGQTPLAFGGNRGLEIMGQWNMSFFLIFFLIFIWIFHIFGF